MNIFLTPPTMFCWLNIAGLLLLTVLHPSHNVDAQSLVELENGDPIQLPPHIAMITNTLCLSNNPGDEVSYARSMGWYTAPAVMLALEAVNADPTLRHMHSTTFELFNTCGRTAREKQVKSVSAVTSAITSENTSAIIGLDGTLAGGQSRGCSNEVRIAATHNLPVLSYVCVKEKEVSGGNEYSTFIQMAQPLSAYGDSVLKFLKDRNWKKLVFVSTSNVRSGGASYSQIKDSLTMALRQHNIQITDEFEVPITHQYPYEGAPPTPYAEIISKSYLKTRIYVVFCEGTSGFSTPTTWLLYTMARFGLLQTGEYFVVTVLYGPTAVLNIALLHQTAEQQAPNTPYNGGLFPNSYLIRTRSYAIPTIPFSEETYRSTAFISEVAPKDSPEYTKFQTDFRDIHDNPPCPPLCGWHPTNTSYFGKMKTTHWMRVVAAYDTVMVYATATNEMLEANQDIRDGEKLIQHVVYRRFKSATGDSFMVDGKAQIEGKMRLLTFHTKGDEYNLWSIGDFRYREDTKTFTFEWYNSTPNIGWIGGESPKDEPDCGFKGERCFSTADTLAVILGSSMAAVVLIFLLIAAGLIWLLYNERQLQRMDWLISRKELILKRFSHLDANSLKSIGSEMGSSKLGSSVGNLRTGSHFRITDYVDNIERDEKNQSLRFRKRKVKQAFDDPEERRWTDVGDFALAQYRNKLIALKRIYKSHSDFTRDIRKEIRQIRSIHHDNMVGFVGIVHEPPHVFVALDFSPRGCLKDILENEDFRLDDMFKASIVTDIVKGMFYLHSSSIGAHGRLKSSNCLVDGRWVVRLSSFGLNRFRFNEQQPQDEDVQQDRELLWTAPELLRQTPGIDLTPTEVLQKADAYSFGIVLYEIYGRQGPYGLEVLEPSDIVERVKFIKESVGLMRPDPVTIRDAPTIVQSAFRGCIQEDPSARPKFQDLKHQLKQLTQGMKANIFDNMMELMEKYTNNLEQVVKERTHALDEERSRSERLLLMMLPKTVADTLKQGKSVEAEAFESVSIYFSDIVGFTSMSSQSTPMQVVAFLNDLYTCFDSILANYDVYKVETIGDAYMVVSGIPIPNGANHAGEIASMSLNLLEAIKVFKIRHLPEERLMLRIGIHSGPCVAGVVGLKMPRYCLFGDTVNTASRMESNGEALKIHCSEPCKLLLESIGGFTVVERGITAMKGKGEQLTYWVIAEDKNYRKDHLIRESRKYESLKKSIMGPD